MLSLGVELVSVVVLLVVALVAVTLAVDAGSVGVGGVTPGHSCGFSGHWVRNSGEQHSCRVSGVSREAGDSQG